MIKDTGEPVPPGATLKDLSDLIRDRNCSSCGVRPVCGFHKDDCGDIVPLCLDCHWEGLDFLDREELRANGLGLPDVESFRDQDR